MVFGKFGKRMKESREARIEATRLMKEEMNRETAAFKEQVEQQTADVIAKQKAEHDERMEWEYRKTLLEAKTEVEKSFTEICEVLENGKEEPEVSEKTRDRLARLPEEQRVEMEADMKDFRTRVEIWRLPRNIAIFENKITRAFQMIKIYWEVPQDFFDDTQVKLARIKELVEKKTQELSLGE